MSAMQNHLWTEEEKEVLRLNYKGSRQSLESLASIIGCGVTVGGVKAQVQTLGLGRIRRDRWSPEEDEELSELITCYSPEKVARAMHRGINSVVIRANRIGCSRKARTGWFTKKDVCQILAVDHKWLQERIESGALVASYHQGRKPTNHGAGFWHIDQADLKRFIQTYPQSLVGRNVDMIMLVEILAGINGGGRR